MIYLDSAATTFQKPPTVARAMTEALSTMSSPGRGDIHWPCGRQIRRFSAARSWRRYLTLEGTRERVNIHYKRNATGWNIAIPRASFPAAGGWWSPAMSTTP